VLIHEEGRLQLCDFGVATVLDKKSDKRRTFIGTPHWMPPELWDRDPEYSMQNKADNEPRSMSGLSVAPYMNALLDDPQMPTCESHNSYAAACAV
jgi:serine/threonine protein kinase